MWAKLLDIWNHQPWVRLGVTVAVALLVAIALHRLARALLWRLSDGHPMAREMLRQARAPMGVLVPLAVLMVALRTRPEAASLHLAETAQQMLAIALVAVATWLGVRCINAAQFFFCRRFPVDMRDNLRARRVLTQARVLGRTASVALILIGLAACLMMIPGVREIGTSLLASAGLAGLAVGLAAKPVLSNLIAGVQIAMAQPIRLDDVVIIEGEWGRIEEITGTYVVVRIWDERRLVVPLNWFIENPFQNWTRTSAQLIGTVYLWLDYRVPLEPLREEVKRLCKAAPQWDGRVCVLQVTDANEHAIQLRILASSADSSSNWDLRCRVREGMIAFVQQHCPESLPRVRAQVGEWGGEPPVASSSRFSSGRGRG
ncbi:MAG: mechanosensitive ion channel [Frateuria sp.]|uniref:mechanosensitive ion channel family protein n=1 Tax=Frateuria sp. TaxID=2211372 RepID=UPI00179F19BD|nr:mechanosensitive ion channel domain-containing protein [Frateuria sp.]NUO73013.1 mechanosensitive ion channel [Frateuria sp.]NUR23521.1 mechanosensitive ion channel [Frateuria sp.]